MSGSKAKTKPGKIRKKNGRPKASEATPTKLIKANAIRADGSPTKLAEYLGISPPSAQKHLKKPDIQKAIITARERAMKEAGLTRLKAYKQLSKQLSAKKAMDIVVRGKIKTAMVDDFQSQDAARKDLLKLFGDYQDDTPMDPDDKSGIKPFIVILPVVQHLDKNI